MNATPGKFRLTNEIAALKKYVELEKLALRGPPGHLFFISGDTNGLTICTLVIAAFRRE